MGRSRLIEGVELALMSTCIHESFTLMVSPEYAYLSDDTLSNGLIPINEKLVFEFDIKSINTC